MFGAEVLFNQLLGDLVFPDGILELVDALVGLAFGLVSLDIQINLADEKLA